MFRTARHLRSRSQPSPRRPARDRQHGRLPAAVEHRDSRRTRPHAPASPGQARRVTGRNRCLSHPSLPADGNDVSFDALVTGWEPLATTVQLPDPDDRHVVAAAWAGRADVIVTDSPPCPRHVRVSLWPASVPSDVRHATHLRPAGASRPTGAAARTGERGVLMALPSRTPRSRGGIVSGGKT